MDPLQFKQLLIAEFPELCDDVEYWGELFHLQVGEFARLTQSAIDRGDNDLLKKTFALADRCFSQADAALKNAFYVSYLESLDLNGPRGDHALQFMSARLQDGWREIVQYLENLALAPRVPPGGAV